MNPVRQSAAICLSLLVFASGTLAGCSKIRNVLLINRYSQNIQVKIGGTNENEKTRVPANDHAFAAGRAYMPSTGTYIYIYSEKGRLLRQMTFSWDGGDDTYQDDLIIIELGP